MEQAVISMKRKVSAVVCCGEIRSQKFQAKVLYFTGFKGLQKTVIITWLQLITLDCENIMF
jgi:hypothetical protein